MTLLEKLFTSTKIGKTITSAPLSNNVNKPAYSSNDSYTITLPDTYSPSAGMSQQDIDDLAKQYGYDPNKPKNSPESKKSSTGLIIGLSLGGVALLATMVVLIVKLKKK